MEKDLEIGRCLSDSERYADLLNVLLLKGECKIHASDLQEVDTQTFLRRFAKNRSDRYHILRRDLMKKSRFGVNFALVGIENQQKVHYLMPIRTMSYDLAEYEKQVSKVSKKIKRMKGITSAEFLSGFRKSDRLHPCITIVLFFGDEWDGAKTLHDLMDFTDIPEELKKYVNDYPVYIFNVAQLENLDLFRTDLKQIFAFLQVAKNKTELRKLVNSDPEYQKMDEDAYDMIAACTHMDKMLEVKQYQGKEGKIDMCQAIKEMLEDERQIGWEEGREELLLVIIRKKIKKNMTLDMIADDLEEDVEVIRPMYEKAKGEKRKLFFKR